MTTTVQYWRTRDGRRIAVSRLDDEHLASILRMGLRARHREELDQALTGLGHAFAGDDGCQYFGELQYEEDLRKARSIPHLQGLLEKSARYAPLLAEAQRRGLRWTRRKVAKTH